MPAAGAVCVCRSTKGCGACSPPAGLSFSSHEGIVLAYAGSHHHKLWAGNWFSGNTDWVVAPEHVCGNFWECQNSNLLYLEYSDQWPFTLQRAAPPGHSWFFSVSFMQSLSFFTCISKNICRMESAVLQVKIQWVFHCAEQNLYWYVTICCWCSLQELDDLSTVRARDGEHCVFGIWEDYFHSARLLCDSPARWTLFWNVSLCAHTRFLCT